MEFIHSVNELLPRQIAHNLRQYLRTMPALVLTGARQTGKSTLAGELTPPVCLFKLLPRTYESRSPWRVPGTPIGG